MISASAPTTICFRNTTVSGQINGLELHLGVIDDPIKGREGHAQPR
jgi:hypothetical protein